MLELMLMNQELISVIVPVYKVEAYIRRCVDSILAQSYQNIEVILVDDGTPDNSGKICDEYATSDGRVKVIHQKNMGLSEARNSGMREATGDYLCFIDSDDFVHCDYCGGLLRLAQEYDAPMAVCGYEFTSGDSVQCNQEPYDITVRDRRDAMYHLINNEHTNYVWRRICKRQLFDGIRFEPGRLCEDIAIMYQLIDRCDKVVYTEAPYYGYFDNSRSIVNTVSSKLEYHTMLGWYEQYQFCKKHYPELKDRCLKQTLHYYLLVYSYSCSMKDENLINARKAVHNDRWELYRVADVKYKIKYWVVTLFPRVMITRNALAKKRKKG